MTIEAPWKDSMVKKIQGSLTRLLKSWDSGYCYVVTFKSAAKKVVKFDTFWCRRPTAHQPLPAIRVNVEFAFLFSSRDKTRSNPQITYTIEHDSFVHTTLQNIDFHILRILKMKTSWFNKNELAMSNAGVINSRLEYDSKSSEQILGPPPEVRVKTVPKRVRGTAEKEAEFENLEAKLLNVFLEADDDGNGYLDKTELRQLLLEGDFGFDTNEVDAIIETADEDHDQKIVYREFIPVAIDVMQAQLARNHADKQVTDSLKECTEYAADRMQGSGPVITKMVKELLHSMSKDGFVPMSTIRKHLFALPLQLDSNEVQGVLMGLEINQDGVQVAVYGTETEQILTSSIMNEWFEKKSTTVEHYIRHSLQRAQTSADHDGCLAFEAVATALENATRIPLTLTHITSILHSYHSIPRIKIKPFSRRAAMLIAKLFDDDLQEQKNQSVARAKVTPYELCLENTKSIVEQDMKEKFRNFDSNDDGFLEPYEFHSCVADTNLALSKIEIEVLLKEADIDKDGKISFHEFMVFATGTLLHTARDATLKHQFEQKEF